MLELEIISEAANKLGFNTETVIELQEAENLQREVEEVLAKYYTKL